MVTVEGLFFIQQGITNKSSKDFIFFMKRNMRSKYVSSKASLGVEYGKSR